MNYDAMRQQLKEKGYFVVKGLLLADEVEHYIRELENRSGITRRDFQDVSGRGFSTKGGNSWNLTDGVTKTPAFWDLIFNETLLDVVRNVVDPEAKFLQHTDLHVGFSAVSWHRDNVSRVFGQGPDWDESDEPYKLVRVAIYLQNFAESNFRLGMIPGSHLPENQVTMMRKFSEAKLKWLGALSYVSPSLQMWAANAEWIATDPGDAIIFDPRAIHSGSYITGPKYSMFVAYGKENKHFANHKNYYRNVRTELNYQDAAPELVQRLIDANLYPSNTPSFDHIDGAWLPASVMRMVVERRVK